MKNSLVVWAILKNSSLLNELTRLISNDIRQIDLELRTGPIPAIPDLIFLECDYLCNFKICGKRFEFALQFPNTPVWLLRHILINPKIKSYSGFITSCLRRFDSLPFIDHKELAARLSIPVWQFLPCHEPISIVVQIQNEIARTKGMHVSLMEIARYYGRSMSWIYKYFKKITGETPGAFIRRIQLCSCLWELLASDMPVKAIAYELQLSPAHLSRAFFSFFGAWPSKLRRKEGRKEGRKEDNP